MQPSFGTSQKIIRQRPASRKEGRNTSKNTPRQRAAADGWGKVTDTMQEPSAQAPQKQNRDEQTAPMPIGDRSQNRENKAEVLGTASQGATADTAGCSRVSRSCGHGSCKRGGRNQHELQRRKHAKERQPIARGEHGDNSRKRENRSRKKAPKPSREPQHRHVLRNLQPKARKGSSDVHGAASTARWKKKPAS